MEGGLSRPMISDDRDNYIEIAIFRHFENGISSSFGSKSAEVWTKISFSTMKVVSPYGKKDFIGNTKDILKK